MAGVSRIDSLTKRLNMRLMAEKRGAMRGFHDLTSRMPKVSTTCGGSGEVGSVVRSMFPTYARR
jgi:hypothetical protein